MTETFGNIGRTTSPDYNDTALLIIREFILVEVTSDRWNANVILYPTFVRMSILPPRADPKRRPGTRSMIGNHQRDFRYALNSASSLASK